MRDWIGGWALPGGGVAVDESALCGAEREAFEETGLSVTATELAIASRDLIQPRGGTGEVEAACAATGRRFRPYGARALQPSTHIIPPEPY